MTLEHYKLFKLNKFFDHRGYFFENFSKDLYEVFKKEDISFVQDNTSFSKKGTIRGLHYQWDNPMGKLIQVLKGEIVDYIVDIRLKSPQFGKVYDFRLTEKDEYALWVPPGYAHGFEAKKNSIVQYKCSSFYNPNGEGAINFFDKDLNISREGDKIRPIMSEKDTKAQTFAEYKSNPKF